MRLMCAKTHPTRCVTAKTFMPSKKVSALKQSQTLDEEK